MFALPLRRSSKDSQASSETDGQAVIVVTQKDRMQLLKSPRGIAYMIPVMLLTLATGLGGIAMIGGGFVEMNADEPDARMLAGKSVSRTRQMGHIEKIWTLCGDEDDEELDFFGRKLESVDETRALAAEEDGPDMVDWLANEDWYFGPWEKPRWFILISVGSFKLTHAIGLCFADMLVPYYLEQLASVCHIILVNLAGYGHETIGDPARVPVVVLTLMNLVKIGLKPPVYKLYQGKPAVETETKI